MAQVVERSSGNRKVTSNLSGHWLEKRYMNAVHLPFNVHISVLTHNTINLGYDLTPLYL